MLWAFINVGSAVRARQDNSFPLLITTLAMPLRAMIIRSNGSRRNFPDATDLSPTPVGSPLQGRARWGSAVPKWCTAIFRRKRYKELLPAGAARVCALLAGGGGEDGGISRCANGGTRIGNPPGRGSSPGGLSMECYSGVCYFLVCTTMLPPPIS